MLSLMPGCWAENYLLWLLGKPLFLGGCRSLPGRLLGLSQMLAASCAQDWHLLQLPPHVRKGFDAQTGAS